MGGQLPPTHVRIKNIMQSKEQIEIQNEILRLKARLGELSILEKEQTNTNDRICQERSAINNRMHFLVGKAEGITQTEKPIKEEAVR